MIKAERILHICRHKGAESQLSNGDKSMAATGPIETAPEQQTSLSSMFQNYNIV